MYFVYIVKTAINSFYTGVSTDPERRAMEHNSSNRGSKALRGQRPVELVWHAGPLSKSIALRLEHRIKKLSHSMKEKLILGVVEMEGLHQARSIRKLGRRGPVPVAGGWGCETCGTPYSGDISKGCPADCYGLVQELERIIKCPDEDSDPLEACFTVARAVAQFHERYKIARATAAKMTEADNRAEHLSIKIDGATCKGCSFAHIQDVNGADDPDLMCSANKQYVLYKPTVEQSVWPPRPSWCRLPIRVGVQNVSGG